MRKHAQQPKKQHSKFSLPFAIAAVIIFVLILGQVIASNHFVTSGFTITELEEKTALLVEENERLAQKIASASSLLTIEEKATVLGFENNPSVIAISANLSVVLD